MEYKELIEKAKKLDEKATPGPWMWDLSERTHQCTLTTTHSGKCYVMGFERWGMLDAIPSFQVYDRYDGKMSERGSHGRVRADKLSKSYPGMEHHIGFDNFIDNPDAIYIAQSREIFHEMLCAITELIGRAEKAECERDALKARYCSAEPCATCENYKNPACGGEGDCLGCKLDCPCNKCNDYSMWKWNGNKVE